MAHVNRFLRKVCRNEDIMRKFSAVALGAMLIIRKCYSSMCAGNKTDNNKRVD